MQRLIFKSEKTSDKIVLSFGMLKGTSSLSTEEQVQLLLKQENTNAEALETHFKNNPEDKLQLDSKQYLD